MQMRLIFYIQLSLYVGRKFINTRIADICPNWYEFYAIKRTKTKKEPQMRWKSVHLSITR